MAEHQFINAYEELKAWLRSRKQDQQTDSHLKVLLGMLEVQAVSVRSSAAVLPLAVPGGGEDSDDMLVDEH
eukprot:9348728-Pyramimonas_sp.AAC.2